MITFIKPLNEYNLDSLTENTIARVFIVEQQDSWQFHLFFRDGKITKVNKDSIDILFDESEQPKRSTCGGKSIDLLEGPIFFLQQKNEDESYTIDKKFIYMIDNNQK